MLCAVWFKVHRDPRDPNRALLSYEERPLTAEGNASPEAERLYRTPNGKLREMLRWKYMRRPIVSLAPMDGITDSAYRRIVREQAREVIVFSEFTSADGFLRSERVRQRLVFHPQEAPYFVQLFGNQPQVFAEAARALEQQGVSGVDINMGCPSKRIVNSQHGSGLMRDVRMACCIVEAVAKACALDVSVKTRLGWHNAEGLQAFAKDLVSAGASLVSIHGRTYQQGFSGRADWGPIYALRRALNVPVLGNGDVSNHAEGLRRMENLDGFMIGRAAIGNPWVFGAALPAWPERVRVIRQHYAYLRESLPERRAVLEFRKHLAGYLSGFPLARALRVRLLRIPGEVELQDALQALGELPAEGSGAEDPDLRDANLSDSQRKTQQPLESDTTSDAGELLSL